MLTSAWIVFVIVIEVMVSPRAEDPVLFCTNKGGPVSLQWRVPDRDSSGTVVIMAPSHSELLECQGGNVSVAPAYQQRVQGATSANGQIQLQLTRVTSRDQGVYQCREGSAVGPTLDTCRQELCYIEINKPNIHPQGLELEGQCMMLSCIGIVPYSEREIGLRYEFDWFKDSVFLPDRRGPHLIIANMTQSDKGQYTCRITEVQRTCATSAESAPFQLHMFMSPSLSIKVSNGTAEVTAAALNITIDDNVILICEVKSASPPVAYEGYRWTVTRSGSDQEEQLEEKTNSLKLSPLSQQSSGVYACRAYNDEGYEGQIPPGRTSINISVYYLRDMVLTAYPDVRVKEGESFSISCKVESSPEASITWYKDGRRSRHVKHNTDNFAELRANRSHTGNYTCLATHSDPRIPPLQQSVNVLVLFEPFVKIKAKTGQKDLNIPENQTLSINEAQSLTLTCDVESPVPLNHSHFFNWTFSLKDSSKDQHKEGDTVTFDHVTKEDSGQYTCRAWSDTNSSCQMLNTSATVQVCVMAEEGPTSDSKIKWAAFAVIPVVGVIVAIYIIRRRGECCFHRDQEKGNSQNAMELENSPDGEDTNSQTPMIKDEP